MQGYTPLSLEHRAAIDEFLKADPPAVSELTFTNLFMWRRHHHPLWREAAGCLALVMATEGRKPFGLMPVGPGDKAAALAELTADLAAAGCDPLVERADAVFVERWVDPGRYRVEPDRDNSDYVYLAEDLRTLAGRKFHRKKNHLNKFRKSSSWEYRSLDDSLVDACLDLQEEWCALRECRLDPGLMSEDAAIAEAFANCCELGYVGGVILVDGKVEAFSLGEMLNPTTAVVHIEKANPAINGLYAAINQQFAEHGLAGATYINREQDLGIEGLRDAKLSYNPDHLVDKFAIFPRDDG